MLWRCIIGLVLTAGWASAESWTNAAGHSVEAELVGRKGDLLTMKRADGSSFTIRSRALSEKSRAAADKKMPPESKPTHAEVVEKRQVQRLKALEEEQSRRRQTAIKN